MSEPWNAQKMAELGHRHAQLETEKKLEPLMSTLVEDPSYEFHPLGRGFTGGDKVRRYYEQFFAGFMNQIAGYELLDEWVNENSVIQEYDITVNVDGQPETHRVIGILFAKDGLLGGERVYGCERVVRLMLGDLYSELEDLGS